MDECLLDYIRKQRKRETANLDDPCRPSTLEVWRCHKYSIVIPTYNRHDLLRQCVASVIKNSAAYDHEIVIVANGRKEPKEDFGDKVRWLWFDEQIGYVKACNQGIAGSDGEYVVLMNDDVQILDWGGN